jgi:hypothetical protein
MFGFDNGQALSEGWAIVECDGSCFGVWQLQHSAGSTVLTDDGQAWRFVRRLAEFGSEYHQEALEFLQEHNPNEYDAVMHIQMEG